MEDLDELIEDVSEQAKHEAKWPNSTAPYQYGMPATDMLELLHFWKDNHNEH